MRRGKLLHEPGREQAHVSRQADQIDFVLLQRGDDFAIMLFARLALGWNDQGFESHALGDFEAAGLRLVGDDDGNAGVGNFARSDILGDGFEVRAASGEEDAEVFHEERLQLSAISFPTLHHNSPRLSS